MTKKWIVLGVALVLVGGFLVWQSSGDDDGSGAADVVGEVVDEVLDTVVDDSSNLPDAPVDVEFEDFEGNTVTLGDFAGTPVVANSWAAWCPFCVKELPDFTELQNEFGNEIKVIAINRAESRNRAVSYIEDQGFDDGLTYWLDTRDRFYSTIGGFSMPETLFITADGKTAFHKRGQMTLHEMRSLVNEHLTK